MLSPGSDLSATSPTTTASPCETAAIEQQLVQLQKESLELQQEIQDHKLQHSTAPLSFLQGLQDASTSFINSLTQSSASSVTSSSSTNTSSSGSGSSDTSVASTLSSSGVHPVVIGIGLQHLQADIHYTALPVSQSQCSTASRSEANSCHQTPPRSRTPTENVGTDGEAVRPQQPREKNTPLPASKLQQRLEKFLADNVTEGTQCSMARDTTTLLAGVGSTQASSLSSREEAGEYNSDVGLTVIDRSGGGVVYKLVDPPPPLHTVEEKSLPDLPQEECELRAMNLNERTTAVAFQLLHGLSPEAGSLAVEAVALGEQEDDDARTDSTADLPVEFQEGAGSDGTTTTTTPSHSSSVQSVHSIHGAESVHSMTEVQPVVAHDSMLGPVTSNNVLQQAERILAATTLQQVAAAAAAAVSAAGNSSVSGTSSSSSSVTSEWSSITSPSPPRSCPSPHFSTLPALPSVIAPTAQHLPAVDDCQSPPPPPPVHALPPKATPPPLPTQIMSTTTPTSTATTVVAPQAQPMPITAELQQWSQAALSALSAAGVANVQELQQQPRDQPHAVGLTEQQQPRHSGSTTTTTPIREHHTPHSAPLPQQKSPFHIQVSSGQKPPTSPGTTRAAGVLSPGNCMNTTAPPLTLGDVYMRQIEQECEQYKALYKVTKQKMEHEASLLQNALNKEKSERIGLEASLKDRDYELIEVKQQLSSRVAHLEILQAGPSPTPASPPPAPQTHPDTDTQHSNLVHNGTQTTPKQTLTCDASTETCDTDKPTTAPFCKLDLPTVCNYLRFRYGLVDESEEFNSLEALCSAGQTTGSRGNMLHNSTRADLEALKCGDIKDLITSLFTELCNCSEDFEAKKSKLHIYAVGTQTKLLHQQLEQHNSSLVNTTASLNDSSNIMHTASDSVPTNSPTAGTEDREINPPYTTPSHITSPLQQQATATSAHNSNMRKDVCHTPQPPTPVPRLSPTSLDVFTLPPQPQLQPMHGSQQQYVTEAGQHQQQHYNVDNTPHPAGNPNPNEQADVLLSHLINYITASLSNAQTGTNNSNHIVNNSMNGLANPHLQQPTVVQQHQTQLPTQHMAAQQTQFPTHPMAVHQTQFPTQPTQGHNTSMQGGDTNNSMDWRATAISPTRRRTDSMNSSSPPVHSSPPRTAPHHTLYNLPVQSTQSLNGVHTINNITGRLDCANPPLPSMPTTAQHSPTSMPPGVGMAHNNSGISDRQGIELMQFAEFAHTQQQTMQHFKENHARQLEQLFNEQHEQFEVIRHMQEDRFAKAQNEHKQRMQILKEYTQQQYDDVHQVPAPSRRLSPRRKGSSSSPKERKRRSPSSSPLKRVHHQDCETPLSVSTPSIASLQATTPHSHGLLHQGEYIPETPLHQRGVDGSPISGSAVRGGGACESPQLRFTPLFSQAAHWNGVQHINKDSPAVGGDESTTTTTTNTSTSTSNPITTTPTGKPVLLTSNMHLPYDSSTNSVQQLVTSLPTTTTRLGRSNASGECVLEPHGSNNQNTHSHHRKSKPNNVSVHTNHNEINNSTTNITYRISPLSQARHRQDSSGLPKTTTTTTVTKRVAASEKTVHHTMNNSTTNNLSAASMEALISDRIQQAATTVQPNHSHTKPRRSSSSGRNGSAPSKHGNTKPELSNLAAAMQAQFMGNPTRGNRFPQQGL